MIIESNINSRDNTIDNFLYRTPFKFHILNKCALLNPLISNEDFFTIKYLLWLITSDYAIVILEKLLIVMSSPKSLSSKKFLS